MVVSNSAGNHICRQKIIGDNMSQPVRLAGKILKVQTEVGAIKKDANNPFFKSKYFDINGLLKVLRSLASKHGVVIMQTLQYDTGLGDKPIPVLKTSAIDGDTGEEYTSFINLPIITDPQKVGSAITYYRRYALQAMFALEAEDDDANSVSRAPQAKKKAPETSGYTSTNPLMP